MTLDTKAAAGSSAARGAGVAAPLAFPQTNLQLFGQMRRSGYTNGDLAVVCRAYDMAVSLFPAKFRGSGKPLLAHLVGTAGILASLRAPATLVAAGVLHAAYIFGDFGDARGGATDDKRAALRDAVGEDVERIISRYDALRWDSSSIAEIHAAVKNLSGEDRGVLLLRLANELEDHLDLGVLYCGNADERREAVRSWLHLCVDLAHQLDQPDLAAAFERVFQEILHDEVPSVLRQPHDYTHDVPPRSTMRKPGVLARGFVDRHPRLGRWLSRARR